MTKDLAVKISRNILWFVVSVIVGWRLTYHIDDVFPGNMPYSVDMFIRFCLKMIGRNDLANPDDMETLALLLYWVIASLLVAAVIFAGYRVLRRFRQTAPH